MQIGLMNNPRTDPVAEIEFVASNAFDFIDLTLEYPAAHIDVIQEQDVLKALETAGIPVVGHTAFYLPFASPINALRDAAVGDVIKTLDFFRKAGAKIVTVHPDPGRGNADSQATIGLNALSFKIISDEARKRDISIVVENTPGLFSSVEPLKSVLNSLPGMGFHLDVGHAFVGRNRFNQILSAFKDQLAHVHLSDNRMRDDDHLPLGAGRIEWTDVVKAIKKTGYDGTFTMEVFSSDRRYVLASVEKFKELWQAA
jgi:sugar phosphate isomerase/epimerase